MAERKRDDGELGVLSHLSKRKAPPKGILKNPLPPAKRSKNVLVPEFMRNAREPETFTEAVPTKRYNQLKGKRTTKSKRKLQTKLGSIRASIHPGAASTKRVPKKTTASKKRKRDDPAKDAAPTPSEIAHRNLVNSISELRVVNPADMLMPESMQSISTAEQREINKRIRKKAQTNRPAPPDPRVFVKQTTEAQLHSIPKPIEVWTMGEMIKAFPGMNVDGSTLQDERALTVIEDAVKKQLMDRVAKLSKPRVLGNICAPGDLGQSLLQQRVQLPLLTASMESFQMGEAGRFPHPIMGAAKYVDYPKCRFDKECVGMKYSILGMPATGIVLTSMMYPVEVTTFLKTGQFPLERRECILCHRMGITTVVLSLRSHRGGRTINLSSNFVFQLIRNPVDTEDGYLSCCVIRTPTGGDWEGLVSPVAMFNLHCLRAVKKEEDGRWYIDQSAMLYKKQPAIDFQPGESVRHFRLRVAHETGRDHRGQYRRVLKQHAKMLKTMVSPSMAVLRAINSDPAMTAQELSDNSRVPSSWNAFPRQPESNASWFSWAARWTLLDSRKDLDDSVRKFWSVLDHPPYEFLVSQCCFWGDTRTGNQYSDLVHLMSKATPQRCQVRKLGELLRKLLGVDARKKGLADARKRGVSKRVPKTTRKRGVTKKGLLDGEDEIQKASKAGASRKRDDTSAAEMVLYRQWLTISLLGLLPMAGCQKKPTFDQTVAWLRHIQNMNTNGFDDAISSDPYVATFALREFMIYVISGCPPMIESLNSMFDWHEFCNITHGVMNSLREQLAAVPLGNTDSETMDAMMAHIASTKTTDMFQLMHIRCLAAGYRRDRESQFETLHSIARGRQGRFKVYAVDHGPKDPNGYGLRIDTIRFLCDWMQQMDPNTHSLVDDIWPHLHDLNIPSQAVSLMTRVCKLSDDGLMGKRDLTKALKSFSVHFKQSMYTMQCITCLWKDRRLPESYPLPAHIFEAQCAAIRSRFHLPGDAPLPLHRVTIDYCKVCDRIYSLKRPPAEMGTAAERVEHALDMQRRMKAKEIPGEERARQSSFCESFGMNGVQHCVVSGRCYCSVNNQNGFMRCCEQPLTALPALGQIVQLTAGKFYTLCPQPECGILMEIDSMQQASTPFDMCCSLCTKKRDASEILDQLLRVNVDFGTELSCVICNSACNPSRAFMCDKGVLLCSQHNKPILHATLSAARARGPLSKADIQHVLGRTSAELKRKELELKQCKGGYGRRRKGSKARGARTRNLFHFQC